MLLEQTKPAFVLLSLGDRSPDSILGDFDYIPVTGCYKGVEERSYLVIANSKEKVDSLLHKATIFNQESILFVDESREATLISTSDNSKVDLGKFVQHKGSIKGLDAWTRDQDGFYWVCKK